MEENGGLAAGRRFGGDETELDLGLSLGKNGRASRIGNCGALLVRDDFSSPSLAPYGSPISSSSSSTASSSPTASTIARSLRPRGQMVGWPPVRAYRMNSVISQKNGAAESTHSKYDEFSRSEIADRAFNKNQNTRKRSFVKVNMDGVPIGRKVDLHSHNTYEELARALDEMFQQPNSEDEYLKCGKNSPLLDLSSGFVITYEDQDGDWMLAGDVPWEMFLSTAQRLRIMRAADVTGLGLNGFTSSS